MSPQHISSVSVTNPAVGVRCAKAQNISTDLFNIKFPVKLWVNRYLTVPTGASSECQDFALPFNISTLNPESSDDLEID